VRLETLGLIGNCQYAALASSSGAIVWCCLPRFDSEPVFGSLLDPDGGELIVCAPDGVPGTQRYLSNTNVLETTFRTPEGAFRVLDFAPRFVQFDRFFRPTMLMRIVEPVDGLPRVCVRCEPRLGWSKDKPVRVHGSNHVRYEGYDAQLRLTTDIPLSYLDGSPFALTERRHLALTWGAPIEEPLRPLATRFLDETALYWQRWVKRCTVPSFYQKEVIRSALALKLHCFEDTGAIVAAVTTSLPESPGSGRNWDYRYCWLRDAYYTLSAFRRIGHFEEREGFTHYLLNVAANQPDLALAPLYRIDGKVDLGEHVLHNWAGYEGNSPVRVGNAAATHLQHDIYGEMVLALAPIFLDERFSNGRTQHTLDLMCRLARRAISVAGTPDAGIWEFREDWRPQTFSSLMCWAAAERVARVTRVHRPQLFDEFQTAAERIQREIEQRAWNETLGTFVSAYEGKELDAALLQMVPLNFLGDRDPRLAQTVDAIYRDLAVGGWVRRYRRDSIGETEVAFTLCTFWLVDALGRLHRTDDARAARIDPRGPDAPRPHRRGLRSDHQTNVGQLPPGVLARGAHPRGVRGLAAVERAGVERQ
jgi:GH15 family glucan-1,4-alpha-glucosidase